MKINIEINNIEELKELLEFAEEPAIMIQQQIHRIDELTEEKTEYMRRSRDLKIKLDSLIAKQTKESKEEDK